VTFAVLRNQADAMHHGLARVGDLELLSTEHDSAARNLAELAKYRHDQLGAPGTHQARDAENLALAQTERHALEYFATGLFGI